MPDPGSPRIVVRRAFGMKIEIFAASGCKSCAAAGDALKNVAATVSSNVAWRMVNVLDELDYAVDLGVLSLPSVAVDGELLFTSLPSPARFREVLEKHARKSNP